MRRSLTLIAVVVATIALAACSDDHMSDGSMPHQSSEQNQPVPSGAREIPVTADAFTFAPKRIQLRAGQPAAIVLTSKDVEHDFFVRGVGHIVHADADETERGGLTIERAGTYAFWCTVPGHRAGGMEGTSTVVA